jgi:UDP-N-acetylmuramate dehydrogenase
MKLSELTTLRVGGEARSVLAPTTRDELIVAVRDVWADDDSLLILGGGSNVLIGDDDFDGTVVRVLTRGIERVPAGGTVTDSTTAGSSGAESAPGASGAVRLRVQAGEPWDDLVAYAVENRLAGIEALSGIPGSTGASPIQNIGAYGQELADALVAIEFLDFLSGDVVRLTAAELGLAYRTSILKTERAGLVLSIELDLVADAAGLSQPIAYAQLASALGVSLGDRVAIADVRSTVLGLRASKGMLLDDNDPDSVSAGSFFTNPIVRQSFARDLPADAPRWPIAPESAPVSVPLNNQPLDEVLSSLVPPVAGPAVPGSGASRPSEPLVKLSAAWLIEHAGIRRGFSLPGSRAAVSSKHTLALTNRGGATATEVSELARYIQTRVLSEFGVRLHPEPVLVGVAF